MVLLQIGPFKVCLAKLSWCALGGPVGGLPRPNRDGKASWQTAWPMPAPESLPVALTGAAETVAQPVEPKPIDGKRRVASIWGA